MEYESDFVSCGICGHTNAKSLIPQERQLVQKLFQCISLSQPRPAACSGCLRKLYNFKDYLKDIIINQAKLVKSTNAKLGMEEDEKNNQHVDGINCKCLLCQQKYGGLPLLVQVIEKNEEKTESQEPQPSTSYDSSSTRKLMKCLHCDKTFTHKGDLNKHMRKHTGEQPFMCSICERKFAHTSNLARHLRLHSGDRPFTCDACNKNFSRKDKLELHRKSCKK